LLIKRKGLSLPLFFLTQISNSKGWKGELRKGFTLIELLVVLVIVSILSGIAAFSYKRFSFNGKRLEAIENLGVIRHLEEAYRAEKGLYVTCEWSPKNIPPPEGTKDWNNSSYFELIGFKPQGTLRYRYAVAKANSNKTLSQCFGNPENCYNDSVDENGFTQVRDGIVDLIIKGEADLDNDGVIGKLFLTDEPSSRVVYLNYSTF